MSHLQHQVRELYLEYAPRESARLAQSHQTAEGNAQHVQNGPSELKNLGLEREAGVDLKY